MGMDTGARGAIKSDINITPLVDVVLVLLIIFMVITPMLQRGKSVELPKARHAMAGKEGPDPLFISVTKDGNVFIEDLTNSDIAQAMRDAPTAERHEHDDHHTDIKPPKDAIVNDTGQQRIDRSNERAGQTPNPNDGTRKDRDNVNATTSADASAGAAPSATAAPATSANDSVAVAAAISFNTVSLLAPVFATNAPRRMEVQPGSVDTVAWVKKTFHRNCRTANLSATFQSRRPGPGPSAGDPRLPRKAARPRGHPRTRPEGQDR